MRSVVSLRTAMATAIVAFAASATLLVAAAPTGASPTADWTQLEPVTPTGSPMAAMADDTASNQLVKFGGQNLSGQAVADTWIWDGSNWISAPPVSGHTPPARYGANMVYDAENNRLLLFGGANGHAQFNDLWVWNATAKDWDQLIADNPSPPAGTQPSPRFLAAMAFNADTAQVVLFGGQSAQTSSLLGDTWILNDGSSTPTWTLESPATSPSERDGAAFAFDPTSNNLLLFGGLTDVGSPGDNGETWYWLGTNWEQLDVSGPSARDGASMALDPTFIGTTNGRDVLFGGDESGTFQNDTWEWDGGLGPSGTWSPVTTAHSPPARAYASMGYDTILGNLILFGGEDATLTDTWEFGISTTATSTAVTSSVNPSLTGQQVTFNVTVTPTPDAGTVNVLSNGIPISGCTSLVVSAGKASCTTSFAFPGTFAITASYSGDASFGGSVSPELNQLVTSGPNQPAGGYWMDASDGGVFAFGDAGFYGSIPGVLPPGVHLAKPIVGMAPTHDGHGYWMVASDGGIFAFGDAQFFGSVPGVLPPGVHLNAPVVGMAPTPDGGGYWLVASDGGVFRFGDAKFLGSTGAMHLNKPVVGMASTPDGNGYWLVASDGGIFAFPDAPFLGSVPGVLPPGVQLNAPVTGMASLATGNGYWLVASDGGIFNFPAAPFFGSAGGLKLNKPVTGMAADFNDDGYWLVATDGGVFKYGNAHFFGSIPGVLPPGVQLAAPIVGIAPSA